MNLGAARPSVGAVPSMAHYAEAFSVMRDRCFRSVHSGVGHARHSPEPIVARGTFTFFDQKGRRWTVDACEGHREELERIDG